MTTKTCIECEIEKPVDDYREGKNQCKDCRRMKDRQYRINNKQKRAEYHAVYYEKNKQKLAAANRKYCAENKEKIKATKIKTAYGLSSEDTQQMLVEQGNCCKICYVKFLGGPKPYVDHCHKTGRIRGLLCMQCNMGLGLAKDNSITLGRAIEYLGQQNE